MVDFLQKFESSGVEIAIDNSIFITKSINLL